jgi:hypothetical protein
METKTDVRMYTVISRNKSKTKLRFVQLTLRQFGQLFSNEVIKVLTQKRKLLLTPIGKIGKISIEKITINSTECLVVNLFSSAFTNRFGGGNFKISTMKIKSSTDKITETVKPTENVVVKQPTLNTPKPSKGNTVSTTKNKTIRTKVISFPNHYIFSYDYSVIIRPNRKILPAYSYLSNVG